MGDDLKDDGDRILSGKGDGAGDGLEEEHAKGVDVDGWAVGKAFQDFRRHEGRGSDPGMGWLVDQLTGDTKVTELGPSVLVQQHVGRLEIPVNDGRGGEVEVIEAGADVEGNSEDGGGSGEEGGHVAECLVEVVGEVLHDDAGADLGGAEAEAGHNVGVAHLEEEVDFLVKHLERRLGDLVEPLDGNLGPPEGGQFDDAKGARAEVRVELQLDGVDLPRLDGIHLDLSLLGRVQFQLGHRLLFFRCSHIGRHPSYQSSS